MTRNEDGTIIWTHARRLYREWGNLKAVLKAFALAIAICFVLVTVICAFADSDFLGTLKTQSKIWGIMLLGFEFFAVLAYYVWAWAQGGVDEWEYTMVGWRVTGRKIVHKAWRMKVLRSFAWILMLAPARPNQKMAMRQLLYDNTQKVIDIWLFNDTKASGDAAKGTIRIESKGVKAEIGVPREDYAEIFALIAKNASKPKPMRKGSRKAKEKEEGNPPSAMDVGM